MDNKETKKINLNDINWNQLDLKKFTELSNNLNFNIKVKTEQEKNDLKNKTIIIEIDSEKYEIKYSDYIRYKSLKSQKSKENFKIKIKEKNDPIMDL